VLAEGFAPAGLAVDETRVFFSDEGLEPASGTISTVPKDGGDVTIIAGGQDEPWSLTIDDSRVYWTNVRGGTVLATTK
jgi:hypothetical protein